MAKPRTLEEYDIRIQDYKTFNGILNEIYLGLRISQMGTMRDIQTEIAKNDKIIADLENEQEQLLNDMQNSQSTDKERSRNGQIHKNDYGC